MEIHYWDNRSIAIVQLLLSMFVAISIAGYGFSRARIADNSARMATLAFVIEPRMELLHGFKFNNTVMLQALNLLLRG
jgi:hypothetical protein